SLHSVGAYRKEIAKQNRVLMLVLVGTSLIGGILGAVLLLRTSQSTFVRLLPYLLLLATVLFAVSPFITARLHKRAPTTKETHFSWLRLAGISLLKLILAIYAGYVSRRIGMLMRS